MKRCTKMLEIIKEKRAARQSARDRGDLAEKILKMNDAQFRFFIEEAVKILGDDTPALNEIINMMQEKKK